MRTREDIERDIEVLEGEIILSEKRAARTSESIRVSRVKIKRLRKELAELDEPQPVPDMDGNKAYIKDDIRGDWYVRSENTINTSCVGPSRETKREAVDVWNKMMGPFQKQDEPKVEYHYAEDVDPDKPRIVEEDGKRFAVFPVRVEIPDGAAVVAIDPNGHPWWYRKSPEYDDADGWYGVMPNSAGVINAKDMIIKVTK
jgi:hypothetical protein